MSDAMITTGNECYIGQVLAEAAERMCSWSVILKLIPFRDGGKWCVLYGENLQTGIAGFGDSPEQAMIAFNTAFCQKVTP